MLGEKVPAPKALEWGLINRVVAGRRAAGRRAGARRAHGAGPHTLLRGVQAPAQRLAVRAHGRPVGARGHASSTRPPGPPTSSKESRRSWRSEPRASAAPTVSEPTAPRRRPLASLYSRPSCPKDVIADACCLRCPLRSWLRSLPPRPPAPACCSPNPAARRTRTASRRSTSWSSSSRCSSSWGSRATLLWALFKFQAHEGPHRRPDPRQHEARGRLDGRRLRDPDLHHGLHVHQAAVHQGPAAVADRRRRQRGGPGGRRPVRLDRTSPCPRATR